MGVVYISYICRSIATVLHCGVMIWAMTSRMEGRGTCYISLPCADPPMSGCVALYSWLHYDRWTTAVTNHPRPALWGQELLPLLSMFWNNTSGHAYTQYNSFKQSGQSKSPLAYRTEFHNLILSLIFWLTSWKFSSKCLLTFVLHVRGVAVIRGIRPGSGWPDREGASSTCSGISSPAGFSLPWQSTKGQIHKYLVLENTNIFIFKHAYWKELQYWRYSF